MRVKEAATKVGISTDTIKRWERDGRVPQPRRDQKGWRIYADADVRRLQKVLAALHRVR